jgi:hypothetical protein
VVDCLSDVVQQAAFLRFGHVRADLGRQQTGQPRSLDHVIQHVLAVAGAVFKPAQQLDELRVQARHASVIGGLLARLAHDRLDLGAALGDGLLDAAGVNPSVADELGERHACHFPAHGVEPG